MEHKKVQYLASVIIKLTGLLLILWWLLMGVLLPQSEAANNFDVVVTHPNWIPINLLGFTAVLLLAISMFMIFHRISDRMGKIGYIGFIISEIGIIWYACIQYYETFIWPIVGASYPEMVKISGELVFGNNIILIPLILSGIFLGVGFILFSINLLKDKIFPNSVVWLLLVGMLLFGNGVIIVVRTIGIVLFVIALFRINNILIKEG